MTHSYNGINNSLLLSNICRIENATDTMLEQNEVIQKQYGDDYFKIASRANDVTTNINRSLFEQSRASNTNTNTTTCEHHLLGVESFDYYNYHDDKYVWLNKQFVFEDNFICWFTRDPNNMVDKTYTVTESDGTTREETKQCQVEAILNYIIIEHLPSTEDPRVISPKITKPCKVKLDMKTEDGRAIESYWVERQNTGALIFEAKIIGDGGFLVHVMTKEEMMSWEDGSKVTLTTQFYTHKDHPPLHDHSVSLIYNNVWWFAQNIENEYEDDTKAYDRTLIIKYNDGKEWKELTSKRFECTKCSCEEFQQKPKEERFNRPGMAQAMFLYATTNPANNHVMLTAVTIAGIVHTIDTVTLEWISRDAVEEFYYTSWSIMIEDPESNICFPYRTTLFDNKDYAYALCVNNTCQIYTDQDYAYFYYNSFERVKLVKVNAYFEPIKEVEAPGDFGHCWHSAWIDKNGVDHGCLVAGSYDNVCASIDFAQPIVEVNNDKILDTYEVDHVIPFYRNADKDVLYPKAGYKYILIGRHDADYYDLHHRIKIPTLVSYKNIVDLTKYLADGYEAIKKDCPTDTYTNEYYADSLLIRDKNYAFSYFEGLSTDYGYHTCGFGNFMLEMKCNKGDIVELVFASECNTNRTLTSLIDAVVMVNEGNSKPKMYMFNFKIPNKKDCPLVYNKDCVYITGAKKDVDYSLLKLDTGEYVLRFVGATYDKISIVLNGMTKFANNERENAITQHVRLRKVSV